VRCWHHGSVATSDEFDEINSSAELVLHLDRLRVRAAAGSGKVRLSVRDIARATGIPRSTLAGYLSGATPVPPDLLGRIVRVLGTTPEETARWVRAGERVAERRIRRVPPDARPVVDRDAEPPTGVPADPVDPTGPTDPSGPDATDPIPPRRRRHRRATVVAAVASALAVLAAAGLVERIARTPSPVTVVRVDSWATVTTDRNGVAGVRYCPATDPCRFTRVPVVLVTGRAPHSGNGIPAALVANGETAEEFTLRAMDQKGNPIAGRFQVWYHAAVVGLRPFEETGTATTTTDERGFATVPYAVTGRGVSTAVVASGVRPSNGPAIPGSVIVTGRTADGFWMRVLSHTGRPLGKTTVTVAYLVAWAAGDDARGQASRHGTTTATTDATGFATIEFPRPLPAAPDGIQAAGVAPASGPGVAATVLPHSATEHGFRVRVLDQHGRGNPARKVTVSYHAVSGPRSVTPGRE
jgi:transcriptional regulator with XRE-family HTH domain